MAAQLRRRPAGVRPAPRRGRVGEPRTGAREAGDVADGVDVLDGAPRRAASRGRPRGRRPGPGRAPARRAGRAGASGPGRREGDGGGQGDGEGAGQRRQQLSGVHVLESFPRGAARAEAHGDARRGGGSTADRWVPGPGGPGSSTARAQREDAHRSLGTGTRTLSDAGGFSSVTYVTDPDGPPNVPGSALRAVTRDVRRGGSRSIARDERHPARRHPARPPRRRDGCRRRRRDRPRAGTCRARGEGRRRGARPRAPAGRRRRAGDRHRPRAGRTRSTSSATTRRTSWRPP